MKEGGSYFGPGKYAPPERWMTPQAAQGMGQVPPPMHLQCVPLAPPSRRRLCRHPDPPTEIWKPRKKRRRHRDRYTGLRHQIARANGLHPIKDRETIARLMAKAIQNATMFMPNTLEHPTEP